MRRWALLWFVALAATAALTAEWMRAPQWPLALGVLALLAVLPWVLVSIAMGQVEHLLRCELRDSVRGDVV